MTLLGTTLYRVLRYFWGLEYDEDREILLEVFSKASIGS